MALPLPSDVDEQLARRLRVVPADETPPPAEVLRQVQAWQERVQQIADTIRWIDDLIASTAVTSNLGRSERDALAHLRAGRVQAFAMMQRLNPDQAWFWTEEWQAKEREADADEAAGRMTFYASTEDFVAALEARMDDRADA